MCNFSLANLKYGEIHAHTAYSDGYAMPNQMAQVAASLGNDAHAMTEHGTCGGLITHWHACNENNIIPILGNEIYLRLPESWTADKNDTRWQTRNSRSGRFHMTLVTTNFEGYKRLIYLNNAAHANMEVSRGKKYPITTFDMIKEFAGDGLLALTGCPASITYHDNEEIASEYVAFLIKAFGKNNVYAELMRHVLTRQDETEFNCWSRPLQLADKFGLQTVWSNDVHAALPEQLEWLTYETRLKGYEFTADAINSRQTAFNTAEQCIGTVEAQKAFTTLSNIIDSVETINFQRPFQLPECDAEIIEMKKFLHQQLQVDITNNNGDVLNGESLTERFNKEWKLFEERNFFGYFAILWDIIKEAQKHEIIYNVRGSASGSYLLYLLGISILHPVEHGLIFERFLCNMRLDKGDLPDVDVDIDSDRRHIVQEYARKKWQFEGVGTYMSHGHRGLVNFIGRIYKANQFKEVPAQLESAAKDDEDWQNTKYRGKTIQEWLDTADSWEYDMIDELAEASPFIKWTQTAPYFLPMYYGKLASISGHGRHACAMAPLLPDMPVPIENWASEGVIGYVESSLDKSLQTLGLIKYDLLGLNAMKIIHKLRQATGVKEPTVIKDNDPCFTVFTSEKLTGLFQFDTRLGREVIRRANASGHNIDSIHVLSALTSLGRPGAMDYADIYFGERNTSHPEFIQKIFDETHGVLIYQEQVAKLFGAMTGEQLDSIALQYGVVALKELVPKHWKQAMTELFKKKYEQLRNMFIDGGKSIHGLDEDYLQKLFESLKGYIRYGFNKSHALSYANLSAQMAWYKYNYPQQYWRVMLNNVKDAQHLAQAMRYIVDAKLDNDITFVPPHINKATDEYTLSDDGTKVYCPLNMIKGLGSKAVSDIVNERNANGPFLSLADFNNRTSIVNRTQKRIMYDAGMFENLPGSLHELGVLQQKEFVVRGKSWVTPTHPELLRKATVLNNNNGLISLDNHQVLRMLTPDVDVARFCKENGIKPKYQCSDLISGTQILYYSILYQGVYYLVNYKRVQYTESHYQHIDTISGIKRALGFAVPDNLAMLYEFANNKIEKRVAYVVDTEVRRTSKTTQLRLNLHDGSRAWFILEDRTKTGFLMKKTVHQYGNVPNVTPGDLVGLTLVTSTKNGEIMTYGQIERCKILA